MRTRSHSPVLSGAGFSQTPVDTATRPRSCTRPARRTTATSSSPSPSRQAAASASSATAVECPSVKTDLRSANSPTTRHAPSSASPASARGVRGPRLHRRLPRRLLVERREDRRQLGARQVGELGIVGTARARRERRADGPGAAQAPVHVGVAREVQHPGHPRDLGPGDPARQALAVPALEDVPQRAAHALRAARGAGRSAGRPRSGRSAPSGAARAGEDRPGEGHDVRRRGSPRSAATGRPSARWGARCRSSRSPSGTGGRRRTRRRPRARRSCSRSSARSPRW